MPDPRCCAITVVAWSPEWIMFHCSVGSSAACCRNSRSYSSHPDPPCRSDSRMMSMAYAKRSRVTMSVVPTARNERKQQSQADKVETSRTLGRADTCRMPVPMVSLMSSSWPRTATLSPSNSRISTNLPDWIMVTNLDGMGLSDIDMLIAGLDEVGAKLARIALEASGRSGERLAPAGTVEDSPILSSALGVGMTPRDNPRR